VPLAPSFAGNAQALARLAVTTPFSHTDHARLISSGQAAVTARMITRKGCRLAPNQAATLGKP